MSLIQMHRLQSNEVHLRIYHFVVSPDMGPKTHMPVRHGWKYVKSQSSNVIKGGHSKET